MAIVKPAVEKKLSALLGAAVTLDKLNFSLLGGSIEALGVTIRADEKSPPVLTVARIKAAIAIKRAMKGEIVIRSLTIERPVVSVVRGADGTNNLPRRATASKTSPVANPPVTNPSTPNGGDAVDDKTPWKLDVEKLLVIDGSASVRLDAYEIGSSRILAEVNRGEGGYSATLLAEGISRRDKNILIGTLRGTATAENVTDLAAIEHAAVEARLQIGELGSVRFVTPDLRSRLGKIEAECAIALSLLLDLLPPRML